MITSSSSGCKYEGYPGKVWLLYSTTEIDMKMTNRGGGREGRRPQLRCRPVGFFRRRQHQPVNAAGDVDKREGGRSWRHENGDRRKNRKGSSKIRWGVTLAWISSQIRTKLRDGAVWQARAGCYSQAALSSNHSKTLYCNSASFWCGFVSKTSPPNHCLSSA